jgi:hypothetical protein
MNPKLKPPGTKRLKLECGTLLSTSCFKFNLRPYNMALKTDPAFRDFSELYARRGLAHKARHVIGCHLNSQEMSV